MRPPDGLAPPRLQGWPALQATCVDRIKRTALRQLHASTAGEKLLLRIYLIGEEATEIALHDELVPTPPEWLARQMAQHLADEQRHAALLADALRQRGWTPSPSRPDRLSRKKIERWHALARAYAPRFAQGVLVPAYAIGLCAEQMAQRVLQRHCETIGPRDALYPLLSGILVDEGRHVRLCRRTLQRSVSTDEWPALEALLQEIRAVDRSFGITGALAMLAAGLALRLVPGRGPMRRPHAT